VSENPYQLGEFVAYNLNEVFNDSDKFNLSEPELNIEADDFQYTQAYRDYENYRVLSRKLEKAISDENTVITSLLEDVVKTNPNYWQSHYLVGQYHYQKKNYQAALNAFKMAQTKEITTVSDQLAIKEYIKKINRKIN